MNLNPEYVTWTRNQIEMLSIGGKWALPRSGTIVTRLLHQRVKIEGPEAANDELRSYIEAAGFTIEGDHPREKAFALFERFKNEISDECDKLLPPLTAISERYEEEQGVTGSDREELRASLGMILGIELMEQGMCLFHDCIDAGHDAAAKLLAKAIAGVMNISPKVAKRPQTKAVVEALLKSL